MFSSCLRYIFEKFYKPSYFKDFSLVNEIFMTL